MGLHRRILVVDDERSVLLVTHRTLVRLGDGYEVVAAQNGREALDRIREAPFVIWMTAYGCGSLMDAAARLMVYGCLEKPVEVAEILRMARKALGSTAGREPAVR
jgi:DNA-binding NtrC family response regulator